MSIWKSIEFTAWGRDCIYTDYLYLCEIQNCEPVSHNNYISLCAIFDDEYENDDY